MRKKWIYGAPVAIVIILGLGSWLWFSNATFQRLNLAFKKLAVGSEEIHPAAKYLQKAIDTHDESEIRQAFIRLYWSGLWKMSEVIPTLNGFLNDSDPFIRNLAAETLFKVGDQSGYPTLLALVQSPDPIIGAGQDLRIQAARTLAQFRQTDATQAIFVLYQQTKNGELIEALQILAPDRVGTLIPPTEYYNDPLAIRDYGLENDRQFLPQITAAFNHSPKLDVKAAAAWALATMTGDQNAINYLVQTAQADLKNEGQTNDFNERAIISYLGTIQTPLSKQTLEVALDSRDPTIVQGAVIYLLYNQGGSDKAVQVIVNQLNDPLHAMLPWDFTLSLAAQLLDNPQIQEAGRKFSQYDPNINEWLLYTVERKNWSIYNWMGGVILKPKKQDRVHP